MTRYTQTVTPKNIYKKGKFNVLYDLSYATRGNSGIPGECRSLGNALHTELQGDVHFLLSPKTFHSRVLNQVSSPENSGYLLTKTLKSLNGRSIIPGKVSTLLTILQSLSLNSTTRLRVVPSVLSENALAFLGISKKEITGGLFLSPISIATRFARPKLLRPFNLKTKNFDFFIQQQIDPIAVTSGTTHIVRLHDILPITHPQYFEDLSVYMFRKGLSMLLKDPEIVWVMDTKASVSDFKKVYPHVKKVFAIPCVVGSQFNFENQSKKVKNSFLALGTIEPRKQTRLILEAFRFAKDSGALPEDSILQIVGNYGWQESQLYEELKSNHFGVDISFHERKSDIEVAELLRKSEFIISASAAEGFGLTPLEGMLFLLWLHLHLWID